MKELEADYAARLVLNDDDLFHRFLADVFGRRVVEPDRGGSTHGVVHSVDLSQILSPALIASIGYAVIRKLSGSPRPTTAYTHGGGPSR